MKKFTGCIAALVLGLLLTACGTEVSDFQQKKMNTAESYALETVLPALTDLMDGSVNDSTFSEYTNEDIEYLVYKMYEITVDGYGYRTAASSFSKAYQEMGAVDLTAEGVFGTPTTTVSGTQIIVSIPVQGALRTGTAELIFSNDIFYELESAAMNVDYTFGEKMGKAGLNTIIGLFTVFAVLILISFLISLFGYIPKIQAKREAKKNAKSGIDNAVEQIVRQETAAAEEEVSDDTELVAVIAAAIAAFEGSVSADGVVIRSIKKIKR